MKGTHILSVFFCAVLTCTTPEGDTVGAAEANGRILAAMGVKNAECGVGQALTFPVIYPVEEASVDLCVAAILASSCSSWSLTNPMPAACLGLPFNKKQSRENYGF